MAESSDEDDTYWASLRSMFATDGGDAGSDEDEDHHHRDISAHTWTSDSGDVTVAYHLAFMAPGHGDALWNSSGCIANHLLAQNRSKLFGPDAEGKMRWPPRRALEFGAGAALPSMILLREGAETVICTDRKVNDETFEALQMSVEKNCEKWGEERKKRMVTKPHTWGEDIEDLTADGGVMDLLVASDCIYNPMYHEVLLQSAAGCISKDEGLFVVGYSFHMNVPPEQVTEFFRKAETQYAFAVVSEFKEDYEGQSGIGSNDHNRGAVYVKVLAHQDSKYCQ